MTPMVIQEGVRPKAGGGASGSPVGRRADDVMRDWQPTAGPAPFDQRERRARRDKHTAESPRFWKTTTLIHARTACASRRFRATPRSGFGRAAVCEVVHRRAAKAEADARKRQESVAIIERRLNSGARHVCRAMSFGLVGSATICGGVRATERSAAARDRTASGAACDPANFARRKPP